MPMQIRCLVLDVDGVLTDGRLWYGEASEPLRAFHIHDGLAIRLFLESGGAVAILTGKKSQAVSNRASELRIPYVIQGSDDKLRDMQALLRELRLDWPQVAMIGDDLPDLPVMRACGYPMAVANAAAPLRGIARYVTARCGGDGAVREAIEHLMQAGGAWAAAAQRYTQNA